MRSLENTSIDRNLVLDFFLTLSRAEFALKHSGYFRGNENGVDPDWDLFVREVSAKFDLDRTPDLSTACHYYLALPPYKQIIENGNLGWSRAMPEFPSELENLIILVRRVRNNLFHGGKYNPQEHDETERNTHLLQFGIVILHEALRLHPRVRASYEQAAI